MELSSANGDADESLVELTAVWLRPLLVDDIGEALPSPQLDGPREQIQRLGGRAAAIGVGAEVGERAEHVDVDGEVRSSRHRQRVATLPHEERRLAPLTVGLEQPLQVGERDPEVPISRIEIEVGP